MKIYIILYWNIKESSLNIFSLPMGILSSFQQIYIKLLLTLRTFVNAEDMQMNKVKSLSL